MITPSQNSYIENNNINAKASNGGKSFSFDFNKGDFNVVDGKLQEIDNLEALKLWISKVIKTTKYKFKVYDGCDYGITDLKELITSGLPLPFIKSENKIKIKETQ